MGGWMGVWVKSCQITKNLIKLDLIEIIQFCLKVYDLWTHSPPLGGCMGEFVGLCQISKNQINHHLIEYTRFYLKMYDLWRSPHLWMGGLLCGSVGGVMPNH